MTNYLRVDMDNCRLVMDRAFARNAAIAGTKEYNTLQAARKDYEGFSVVTRQIKRNPNKECYAGLTYAYMEDYILTHEQPSTVEAVLNEFNEMRLIAACHSKAFRYPTIKKWFLNKYPEIKFFGREKGNLIPIGNNDNPEANESVVNF